VALPKKKARAIAQQLCAGLAEAHRKKVIHGDLKSNNVILAAEPDGSVRAVITDFGLARRPEAPGELVAGTPEYMAPELWQGAKPSMASDIYALGVILCELFSGAKPGELGSAASTLPLGDHHKQIPATENRKWNRVLARCLDPDPAHRFSSAEEVSRALGPSRARRWALGIAATVLLAAGSGIAAYFGALTPTEDVRLAVLPFEAGRNAEPLKEKLLRDVTDRVGRLKGDKHTQLEVIPLNNVLRKHADSVEKASAMLGATHVLRGTIETDKDQVKLLAFLTDARSRVDVKEWEAKYDTAQERYISGALASMVTDTFHLPPLARGPTNAAARGDYQAGLVYLRRDSTIPAALASFERAVHADPDSALAYAGLAEAQWFEYFLSKQRIWVDRSAESARQAECRNMDLAPVHRVMGLHLDNAGYYEQAEAEYRRAIELEPQDAENYRRLGQVYEKNNRKEEALAAFQTAVSLRPDYYRAHLELGAYHYNRGDYTRAIASFRQTVDLAPREPNARFALGATYLNSGMYAEAERQLRLAVALDESPNPLHSLGLALMYQARDDEAIGYFSRALRRNPESYLSWMYLGIADRRTNRAAESAEANMRGREVAEAEMARNPRNTYVRSVRGYFAAALGDRIRAESETAQAMSLAPDDAETRWAAILTYEALGEREASLAILNRSPRQQVMDISRWPDLADLQHDPRFLQLLAKFNLK
jgi:tetratricopeptide (TPR) repeat protein/TolB-like protein